MSTSNTLALLLEHAERERDAALAAHGEAQAALARAQSQADDLVQYRASYQQRWIGEAQNGVGIETFQCVHSFAERLSQALGQQGQLIQVLESRWNATRDALQQRELRVASLKKLIERRQSEALQIAQRQDQKLNDEWAARAHRSLTP
ncbi:flagellar export protein FliJ [Inhella gelatinilytica]|uniref:Flagellar FliJ protein n=1 Tax=Inhella gelatinilytica TaxID=2795030 RepID=A0A931IV61_9BURK|nr:flagellar export protein FliJ [Inhella gelatinilytica]MBH9552744.1 flagellar export protein FliJ [Inhella gelatinilytica]